MVCLINIYIYNKINKQQNKTMHSELWRTVIVKMKFIKYKVSYVVKRTVSFTE